MKRHLLIELIAFLLIVLFIYATLSKLFDLPEYRLQMDRQVFTPGMKHLLFWLVPLAEIVASALLLFNRTRLRGFYLAVILLVIFTAYIALVLLHFFHAIPCSCGGVLKMLTWKAHLLFNLLFLLLSVLGIIMTYRERRAASPLH